MKAEIETTVSYKVEVECLDSDPILGNPLPDNRALEHARRILSALPYMDDVEGRIVGEVELMSVKIWRFDDPGTGWLLFYQYAFDKEAIAHRVAARKEVIGKLGAWRAGASPGDSASLGEILDS